MLPTRHHRGQVRSTVALIVTAWLGGACVGASGGAGDASNGDILLDLSDGGNVADGGGPSDLAVDPDLGVQPDDAGARDQGGRVSDGGAVDVGLSDGAPDDGGPPVSCPGPFVLCEDFESGINGSVWTEQGTAAIDTSHVHRGGHAIHFSANNTLLRTSTPFPQLSHDLWGRVFVYMDQTPPGSTTSMMGPNASFAWAAGNGGDTRVGFRHTRYSAGYNYPGDDFTNTDDLVWPLNQWVCVEWHYLSDPATGTGTQDYWMDGMPRPRMHFDAHPMPAFTYFWIGMYLFGTTPFDMWMDDLVLDTQQIGCAR